MMLRSLRRADVMAAVLACSTILLALALRVPSLFEPRWYGDEGIFAAIATNMRDGRMLYSEAWDNKPPLIFFTYAAAQELGGTGVMTLHVAATIAVLSTQAVVILIAARLYGWRRAGIAGLAFALLMGTPVIEGNLALTETFMILPASLAMLAAAHGLDRDERLRPRYMLAAGLFFGIAAGYKQVAVFDAAALAVLLAVTQERPAASLAALGAGFAVPQAALAALFLVGGAFSDYAYAIAGSLGLYAELAPARGPLLRFATLLPALLVTAWLVRRRNLGDRVAAADIAPLWLAFALAGAMSSTFPFPHYLQQAAPALALTLAMPVRVGRDVAARAGLVAAGTLAAVVAFGQFGGEMRERDQTHVLHYYRTFNEHREGVLGEFGYEMAFDGKAVAVRDVSSYMEQDDAGRTLFVWGELPWLFASGYENPTRYYTSFLGEHIPGARPEIIRDLGLRPPAYVVISDDADAPFPDLERLVTQDYTLLRAEGDWRLYRLQRLEGRLDPAGNESVSRGR